MQLTEELRLPDRAERLIHAIARALQPGRSYRLMEFCGGHTHALCQSGLIDRLPPPVHMIHGPGCPVCVLPTGRLQQAIDLALREPVTLCSYGDMLRVPGRGRQSLLSARAQGADVRVIYSTEDALALAQKLPERQVVLLSVGFETTTPMTAAAIMRAAREGLPNFSVLCNHVLTPAALGALLTCDDTRNDIDGFIGPGHVATLTGSDAFACLAEQFGKPIAIAGFEPLDLLSAILMIVDQINRGSHAVSNVFARAVTGSGNLRAQQLVQKVFELRESFSWRGLGDIPLSALRIRPEFATFDAERRFALTSEVIPDHKHCRCPDVLRGVCGPTECTLFGSACTPDTPLGSCMVSSEGACAAYFQLGRARRPASRSPSRPKESAPLPAESSHA